MIIIALAVPILGLLGDLVFSAIKRAMKVKDFSNLIPGHGGILDRLDSFIFVLGILFFLIAISIGKNESFLENDLKEFKTIKKVYSSNKLKNQNNFKIDFINENIENLIDNDTDIVINALSGFYGLKVTIESILKNKIILLANKESFVCADSEHCAIFQCLEKENKIEKILLTASGGPFLNLTVEETKNVNKDFALKHPK
ncbi:hypothetical protein FQR65_LT18576 [Abscondita terminalis]|nr:hypothetical protein FQR65_LT18576 [Abscondita terminalis]